MGEVAPSNLNFDLSFRSKRHHAPIRPRQDRLHSRIGRQQLACARFASDADRSRERIRCGRARTDDRNLNEAVGARAGVWIEDMVEAPARLKWRAVAAR